MQTNTSYGGFFDYRYAYYPLDLFIYFFSNRNYFTIVIMKITSTTLLVFAATSLIVIGPLSLGNVYALKDKDDRYEIVTLKMSKAEI